MYNVTIVIHAVVISNYLQCDYSNTRGGDLYTWVGNAYDGDLRHGEWMQCKHLTRHRKHCDMCNGDLQVNTENTVIRVMVKEQRQRDSRQMGQSSRWSTVWQRGWTWLSSGWHTGGSPPSSRISSSWAHHQDTFEHALISSVYWFSWQGLQNRFYTRGQWPQIWS